MEEYQLNNELYDFRYLPGFAKFLLDNHLEEFTRNQLSLSRQWKLPLLKLFGHLTEDQLFKLAKKNMAELLTVLSENKAKEYLEESLKKWVNNEHELFGKFDLVAEDITLANRLRQKGLKKWITRYTSDVNEILALSDEIDDHTFASNTAGTNTYIRILTRRLERKSEQLLEAQTIAQVGSFEWNFVEISRHNSPELRKIFETDEPQSYEDMLAKVHPDDRERVKKSVEQSLIDGTYNCEYRYRTGNKEKVLWTKAVIHYENGKPVLMTGTVQDITERKKIEQSLLQKTFELEVSNSNLEKFAFIASHDLQEPLRKILMHADLLIATEKDRLSERGKELLDKISASGQKMKQLIKDILTYSTINPQQEREQVNLEELLQEVKTDLEPVINVKKATIVSDNLPSASVYPSQMRQLLQNLVGNSIKFSKKHVPPVVNISHAFVSREELNGRQLPPASSYLKIEITDNGIGFKKDYAEEIFSLFKRLHTQKEFEGSGLGLAICRKVVENHGGLIEASGVDNGGAKFSIILPQ